MPRRSSNAAAAIAVYGCLALACHLLWSSIALVVNAVTYHQLRHAKEGPSTDELASIFE